MFKRIGLFLATNLAVLVLLGLVMSGLQMAGINLNNKGTLLIMAAVMGMGGSLISLSISKWVAKRMMGVQLITTPGSEVERWLVEVVRRQAQKADIRMPEVGIFDSPDVNAFATGPSRNNALVAVSTGLLQHMDRDEIEAVLGHEVSHVANGDMVTMALIQGVLNTFVIFMSRIAGRMIDQAVFGSRGGNGPGYFVSVLVLDLVFGLLASMIAAWFSRQREFRADAGGAGLAGREKMIAALQRLERVSDPQALPRQMAAFGILGGRLSGLGRLLMSHPPLAERISALRQGRVGMSR